MADQKSTTSDDTKPKTFRSDSCHQKLLDSFSGPILDNATVFESKADVPDENAEHTVVATTDGTEGILMSELFVSISGSCSDGSITGRNVVGKVKL